MTREDEMRDLAACCTRFQHAVAEMRRMDAEGVRLGEVDTPLPGIAYRACEGIRAFGGPALSNAANAVRQAQQDGLYGTGMFGAYERALLAMGAAPSWQDGAER